MKKTPFYDIHTNLGAKISLFGGYQMPIQYSGVKEEHLAIRNKVGVFDVSHMGEFWVEGPNAFDLLQFVCSNDISKLVPGKAQYNYMPNYEGGVVDDLIVYQLHAEKYLLVVNASNIEKDWNHIIKQNQKFKAKLENKSEKTALLAIQGPKAIAAMQSICN
ncbi:MAG: glycine cleavage system aminomethyltransferase GcvT, partial [Bacteroidota bacterium]|nr:glycine cleavage system aminomethyltransferase GcvT [Bacteroidota bacterium]